MDDPGQLFGLSRTAFPDSSFVLLNGHDSTREQSAHRQDRYEIQYVVSGQAYVSVNAQKLYLSEGDYVVLVPGDLHALKAKEDVRWYSVEFAVGEHVGEHSVSGTLRDALTRRREAPAVSLKNAALQPVLEDLFCEWRERKLAYVDYIDALFLQILLLCCRDAVGAEREGQAPDDLLGEFLSFLGVRMDDPDVIASFEKAYGCSRAALSRTAKEKYGKTLFQLYTEKRFEYAVRLLAEGRIPVTEIARRCAFSSAAAFSKAFTKHCGVSPSRYVRAEPTPGEGSRREIYADFSTCSVMLPLAPEPEPERDAEEKKPEYTNPKWQLL